MKINHKKLSKQEIQEFINKIFSSNPGPKEVKKAKRLAMSKNIKLSSLKKKFCKKCYSFFNDTNHEIRIKKGFKSVKCKNCGYLSRYKIQ